MVSVDVRPLIGKLDSQCRTTLTEAISLALTNTHYNAEIEHWLLRLLDHSGVDLAAIMRHYEVDAGKVAKELLTKVDGFKRGNARTPALSPEVISLIKAAWLIASVEYGAAHIRSGHLLLALLGDESLARLGRLASTELASISPDALKQDLLTITADTEEGTEQMALEEPGTGGAAGVPGKASKTPALDQFTVDLTLAAKHGKIDPVLGRDAEVRQIVDILTRRRQNNPILTGEAGVGKTAVVEGFAQRIAEGDVPPPLRNVTIRTLDLALLQAGAGVKGEFENRLKSVINEVKSSPKPIILFIDEAHTMIGAGGQAGQGDAANLLKPALARGELRTIAATTWAEYKKYFERDAALARRFQVVKVEEPAERSAVEMMRGLAGTLEQHHKVRILDEALEEAVRLSSRYISGRQLPDKAVSLLDTACANVAVGHSGIPAEIEDARRRIEQLDVAIGILHREEAVGSDHAEQLGELETEKAGVSEELAALEKRWDKEKTLVSAIRELRAKLEGAEPSAAEADAGDDTSQAQEQNAEQHVGQGPSDTERENADAAEAGLSAQDRERLVAELAGKNDMLAALQGENPLMHVCVDGQAIAKVVSDWTGIPVGRMLSDEINAVLNLKERMGEYVVGQDHALDAIAQSIRTSRAHLADPRQPIGVFMLAGPSGVGKTETGITLANLLYGGEQNMTVINMSEFKEEHKVSLLMGSPPGYVGYGEGGVLTEAVRRKPYSVVLLDEMEKAHPGVQDIFYQVFDKGTLRDGEGRDIDFKNTVILMTTNAGTDVIMSLCADEETAPGAEGLAKATHEDLLNTFKPAFLGRLNLVPYYPLAEDVMKRIVDLKMNKIRRRVRESYRAELSYDDALVQHVVDRCEEVETGARNVDHILNRTLLPEMAQEFLARTAQGKTVGRVNISVDDEDAFVYDIQ
jgi:type VI secretion system protein VasG